MLQCTPPMAHVVTFQHFFQGKSRKKVYMVLLKQNHIIVRDMWEINVGKKILKIDLPQTEKVPCEIQHILSVV